MKPILFFIAVLFSASLKAQDFTFSTDSLLWGANVYPNAKAQKSASILVRIGNIITVYKLSFHCTDGSLYIDKYEFVLKEKTNQVDKMTAIYDAVSRDGVYTTILINELIHTVAFYPFIKDRDAMFF